MKVTLYNQQRDLPLLGNSVRQLVFCLSQAFRVTSPEVIVHFVTEKKISLLHRDFFDDPTPTDCISFPIDAAVLGEIFICPKVALRYARAHNLDPYEETSRYLVHGLLHLLGYEDTQPKERAKMRAQERRSLTLLRSQGLLLSPLSKTPSKVMNKS